MTRIVHLSDLHFTPKKDWKVWAEVARFINEEVRPDAILVTGDVTDNAKTAEFELAERGLDMLKIQNPQPGVPAYRIIPGNHDRYSILGNRINLPIFGLRSYKAKAFEGTFGDARHVKPSGVADLVLGQNGTSWRVRVIGLDSNHAKWFAQGAIEEPDVVNASRSARTADTSKCDLVIALVHHHVLSIPDVERRAMSVKGLFGAGGLVNVANVTGMLNSGVLLQHFSKAQVNIVLHGHEHSVHQAVYRNAHAESGSTVVLAAGSGSGEETGKGWALHRVHFNVLDLKTDRTVELLHASFVDNQLKLTAGPVLLSAREIRRSRFIRRHPVADGTIPVCRLKKLVVVGLDRSAEITETSTEYLVGTLWSMTTGNSSGFVEDARITFEFRDSEPTTYETPFFQDIDNGPDAFACGVPLPKRSTALAERITARWKWVGAVVLTKQELEQVPVSARTSLRKMGLEFIGITIESEDEFQSAALTLHLPENYEPARKDVCVYFESPDEPGVEQLSLELTERLEFCGPGHIELRIAFPLPGHRYYISWVLPPDKSLTRSERLAIKVSANGEHLLLLAAKTVKAGHPQGEVRIGLYACSPDQAHALACCASDAGGPQQIRMNDPRSRARAALWGRHHAIWRGHDVNSDLLQDEEMLIYVPVRPISTNGMRGAAILRVALLRRNGLDSDLEQVRPVARQLIQRSDVAAVEIAQEAENL